jgi:hypothetical protein
MACMRNACKMLDRKDTWQEPFGTRGCEWEDIKVDVCVPKSSKFQLQAECTLNSEEPLFHGIR